MKYTTNLFTKTEEATIDKITFFALHYLRYILVITQFVTICVFFYRFKADQEIVDLKDTLSQKKAIVESTQSLLANVKQLDFKIKNIKNLYQQQNSFKNQYDYVFQHLPQDVSLTTFNMENSNIEIIGLTQNISTVQAMYEQLQKEKKFKSVVLDSITKGEKGFSFTLKLTNYKQ
jgi:Tfp pilus assembly protein PilN